MRKIAVTAGILAASLFSAGIYANSYNRGIKLYRRADFKGAESAFIDVLRGGANRATKGRVYKYIGLSQYMLGRKNEARASFHSALKYDPKTEIYPDEALDSSVLEFFLQIKQDSKKGIGVIPSPPPVSGGYSPRAPSKRTAPRLPPRRASVPKAVPKPVAKKPVSKRALSAKPSGKQNARGTRQAAQKKAKKDSLFTGKGRKPPRVIFDKKGKAGGRQTRAERLLLPPGADGSESRQREGLDLWRLLPFGVGQYANDNYKLGHAFAAAGILTLGSFAFYLYRWQDDQVVLDDFYLERDAARRNTPNKKEHLAEWDATVTEWEEYVAALKLYSYLSLAGFVAVWAGGAIEAVVNRPTLREYSLLVPEVHYGYDHHGHQLALLWQYRLP